MASPGSISPPMSGLAETCQAPVIRRWEPKKLLRSFLHSTILHRKGLGGPKHPGVEKQDSGPRMSKKGPATSNACWKIEIN